MDPVCTGAQPHGLDQLVYVPAGPTRLTGCLSIPIGARGIVLFAHGSGSSRQSVRNRFVAGELQSAGLATLLFDLLTPEEGILDEKSRQFRFDIGLLASRLSVAAAWIARIPATRSLRVGYFGASTGPALL